MQETGRPIGERLAYRELDLISIPEGIPALGVERGDRGLVQNLDLRNDTVVALVKVAYSTGQTRGFIEMNVAPKKEVLSYSPTS